MRISAAIIVKNEAKHIAACIASLRLCCDEIIVLDTGSSDTTVQIAQEAGAFVYQIAWKNNFATARNVAARYCTGDWIISIDADERLLHPEKVKPALAQLSDKAGGVFVERHNLYRTASGKNDIEVRSNVKIYRNHPRIQYRHPIHEEVWSCATDAGFTIESSSIVYQHLLHEEQPQVLKSKQVSYLQKLHDAYKKSKSAYLLMHIGKTLLYLDQPKKAVPYFDRALDKPFSYRNTDMLCFAYRYYAQRLEGKEDLLDRLEKTIELYPTASLLQHYAMEHCLFHQYTKKGEKLLDNILVSGAGKPITFVADKLLLPEQKTLYKAKFLLQQQDLDDAKTILNTCTPHTFIAAEFELLKGNISLMQGDIATANEHWNSAYERNPEWTLLKRKECD